MWDMISCLVLIAQSHAVQNELRVRQLPAPGTEWKRGTRYHLESCMWTGPNTEALKCCTHRKHSVIYFGLQITPSLSCSDCLHNRSHFRKAWHPFVPMRLGIGLLPAPAVGLVSMRVGEQGGEVPEMWRSSRIYIRLQLPQKSWAKCQTILCRPQSLFPPQLKISSPYDWWVLFCCCIWRHPASTDAPAHPSPRGELWSEVHRCSWESLFVFWTHTQAGRQCW